MGTYAGGYNSWTHPVLDRSDTAQNFSSARKMTFIAGGREDALRHVFLAVIR